MYERYCYGCCKPDTEVSWSGNPEDSPLCECGAHDIVDIDIWWILEQMDEAIKRLKGNLSREDTYLSKQLSVVRDIVEGELDMYPNHNKFYFDKISELKREKMLLNMECNNLFTKLYPNHPGDLT